MVALDPRRSCEIFPKSRRTTCKRRPAGVYGMSAQPGQEETMGLTFVRSRRLPSLVVAIVFVLLAARSAQAQISVPTPAERFWAWERTSPCLDGRQEWFTPSANNPAHPGGVMNVWRPKDGPFDTYAMASAAADALKLQITRPTFRAV